MMAQDTSADYVQVVSFGIVNSSGKKEDYAIPIEQVREIRTVEKITKVPRSESYVKGIMNLRGLIIPVVDVKEKLRLGSTEKINSVKQKILVADINGSLTGILVDDVDQVLRLETKDIESAPQGTFESYHYIMGIAKINEKLMILLDVENLLGSPKEKPERPPADAPRPQEKSAKKAPPEGKSKTEDSKSSEQKPSEEIPPELAQVFKEDEEGTPPTEIIREAKTISEL